MKESMKKISVTKEQIVRDLVDEIRELISVSEGSELLSIGVHGRLGVTLKWLDEDEDGTAENLAVGIIPTSGSLADRHRVDAEHLGQRLLREVQLLAQRLAGVPGHEPSLVD
jgi:hypothetical protein